MNIILSNCICFWWISFRSANFSQTLFWKKVHSINYGFIQPCRHTDMYLRCNSRLNFEKHNRQLHMCLALYIIVQWYWILLTDNIVPWIYQILNPHLILNPCKQTNKQTYKAKKALRDSCTVWYREVSEIAGKRPVYATHYVHIHKMLDPIFDLDIFNGYACALKTFCWFRLNCHMNKMSMRKCAWPSENQALTLN